MSRTTKIGAKIKLPMAEFWIERTIEDMKSEIKKRSNKSLFKKSKNEDELTSRFRDFLLIAEKDMERSLWDAKTFAEQGDLGKETTSGVSALFSLSIGIFNDIIMRFDAENLSEDLLNHLKRELKMLNTKAGSLWELQGLNPTQNPQAKQRAQELINGMRGNLWEFKQRMEPYLRKEKDEENKNSL
jgi:hypothetical protein